MKNITVIGAGATGHALAANLAIKGHNVILYEKPKYKKNLNIIKKRGINITGDCKKDQVNIYKCTTNIVEALNKSKLIIIAVRASRHKKIAKLCKNHLKSEHNILITPGNMGSLIFYNQLDDKIKSNITLAEVESNLYVCRLIEVGKVEILLSPDFRYISAFPAKDTKNVMEIYRDLFNFKSAKLIIETTLNLPNIDSHLPGSLLNIGLIEKGNDNYFYKDFLNNKVLECIKALHKEKNKLMQCLELKNRTSIKLLKNIVDNKNLGKLNSIYKVKAPNTTKHRFIEEDVIAGLSLMLSLGNMLKLSLPVTKSLVTLASTINNKDYYNNGRTLENLSLPNKNIDNLDQYLTKGE